MTEINEIPEPFTLQESLESIRDVVVLPFRARVGLRLLAVKAEIEAGNCERMQKGYNCRPLGCVACGGER